MARYVKRPVEVEAVRWDGTNEDEVEALMGYSPSGTEDQLFIHTLEGTVTASVGDYIVKGVNGEFYPCKPDIFEKTNRRVW